ncbi:helix-turn-helix domain-containing protein [Natrialba asiatica]|uniref:Bacterio-opsin activator HTH domain-containing protein n=1 Tax=Natrialba asiatica (strain ATCC 700177 / DSM 12278 / JCM 9576 / FERM P-10747 / NBRC 102637 / 172P1) TaxID=29540 RepID=M0B2U6_NATA1|nr:helix-turn-helix domain-containing protein [Natrialba asiatica]ELZ05236.1 bacterio-opsin activator HTH domain-containing protein [Natrialba asiatica DSM 12278]
MKSMSVELRYSDEALIPLHRELCESPALDREIILGGQSVDGVETISSFVYGSPDAYESILAEQESVLEYDLTPDEDGFFVYLRQELGPQGLSMMDSLAQDTVVIVPPIEFRSDQTMRMTVVGHPDDLRAVSDSIPEGISIEILKIGDGVMTFETSISERQQDALRVAWDVGYFDVPRRNGIETVAAELDCAVSTASELLRRGEAHAISRLLETDL